MSETTVDPVDNSDEEVATTRDPSINPADPPVRPTAVDSTGTERIVGAPATGWTPAPVEPTEEQVRVMDEHNAREAARREQRQDALTNPDVVGDTAQPLVEANKAAVAEQEAALAAADAEATPAPVDALETPVVEDPPAEGTDVPSEKETY